MMKHPVIYLLSGLILCVMVLGSCRATKNKDREYDYLREKNAQRIPENGEPYEVIDIAVLDTSQQATDIVVGNPTDSLSNSTENPSATPASKAIVKVLNTARSYLGVPYQWGGMDRTGMDCSGLVVAAYLSLPLNLPRTSRALALAGRFVELNEMRVGDLVFFSSRMDGNINHVGLVTHVEGPEITFIHATVSRGVREDRLDIGYWSDRFMRAVRVGF